MNILRVNWSWRRIFDFMLPKQHPLAKFAEITVERLNELRAFVAVSQAFSATFTNHP